MFQPRQSPLIETSTSLQADRLGTEEVRGLPVNRRNLTNLMSLTPGVSTSGAGDVQMNGVAAGGTGVTVDGTDLLRQSHGSTEDGDHF